MSKNERKELNKKSLELIRNKNANELYEMIGTELLAIDSSILDASPSLGGNRRHEQGELNGETVILNSGKRRSLYTNEDFG